MKLACVQFSPKFFNLEDNLEYIVRNYTKIESEIIIFPELSSCGYFYTQKEQIKDYLIDKNSDIFIELYAITNKLNKCLIFGFGKRDSGKIYNSSAMLIPNIEQPIIYRKTHLFYKERFIFDEGDTGFNVAKWDEKDINIGMMICYDWRFPEAARTLALKGADLIACPSNLVTNVWQDAMKIRALENAVFLAVANRTGSETSDGETLTFRGNSMFCSSKGEIVGMLDQTEENILTIEFNHLEARNKKFNEFNDPIADRREGHYYR